jgi:tight adherence protein B
MVNLPGSWLPALLVFLAVALVTIALAVLVEWLAERSRKRKVAEQLGRLAVESLEPAGPGSAKLFRNDPVAEAAWVRALTARVPRVGDLVHLLEQAALNWTVKSFLLLSVGLSLAMGLGVLLFFGSKPVALGAGVLGALLPRLYVKRRRARRLDTFEANFPETVDLLGRAIRAGHPLSSGLKMVADETEDPISGEFSRVFEELRFGLSFEDSVTALADRVPLTDVRIFVTAILIQREVGGNLAEILDNLSSIIRQRFTLKRQVKVLTAEGRLSMYVLTALPIGVGIWIGFTNPEYISLLFTHPIGKMMVGVALVMQAIGFLWMRRITNIEF